MRVHPQMESGGNSSVQTAASGTDYAPLADRPCAQVTIVNDTGTKILVQQDGIGAGLPVLDQTSFTFYGLTNAKQLAVKRSDSSASQVTVPYRWEAI